ncbi:hypothetical protein ACTMTJ_41810 [Phytohabitans sp. LJ34]
MTMAAGHDHVARWERHLDIHDGLVSLARVLICWCRLTNWTTQ